MLLIIQNAQIANNGLNKYARFDFRFKEGVIGCLNLPMG